MYLDAIEHFSLRTAMPTTEQPVTPRGDAHPVEHLVEGETRIYGLCEKGVIFETDYVTPDESERAFTVLWKNADASGFLNSKNGDAIVGIRY